jgi:hypothetical protein
MHSSQAKRPHGKLLRKQEYNIKIKDKEVRCDGVDCIVWLSGGLL